MAKKIVTYKESIQELEQILKDLEDNNLDIDMLSIKVKRAAELVKICKEKLYSTNEEVEEILKSIE